MTCAYFRPDHCLVERLGENSGGDQSAMHSNALKEHKKNEGMIEGDTLNIDRGCCIASFRRAGNGPGVRRPWPGPRDRGWTARAGPADAVHPPALPVRPGSARRHDGCRSSGAGSEHDQQVARRSRIDRDLLCCGVGFFAKSGRSELRAIRIPAGGCSVGVTSCETLTMAAWLRKSRAGASTPAGAEKGLRWRWFLGSRGAGEPLGHIERAVTFPH